MTVREEHHDTPSTAGTAGDPEAAGTPAPVRLDVALHAGRVEVVGGTRPGVAVRVEAESGPESSVPWWGGPAAILGRIEEHLTGEALDPEERAARAVAGTTVTWDPDARELRVAAPDERALRSVPLVVTLTVAGVGDGAGEGGGGVAALAVRAGAAATHAAIPVGTVEIEGTGEVDLVETRGRTTVRAGAGAVHIGTAGAALRVRGGAGEVRVDEARGPVEVTSGAARVHLGEVHADVAVRIAAGDVEIDDVAAGDLDLTTGAGAVRVGLRAGVDARLDLDTVAGRARSELPVHAARVPDSGASRDPVRVRARSTAGDVVVRAAT